MRPNSVEAMFIQHSGGVYYNVLFLRPATWKRKRSRQDRNRRRYELESFSRRFAIGNYQVWGARRPSTIRITAERGNERSHFEGLASTLGCGLVGGWSRAAYPKHNLKFHSGTSLRGPSRTSPCDLGRRKVPFTFVRHPVTGRALSCPQSELEGTLVIEVSPWVIGANLISTAGNDPYVAAMGEAQVKRWLSSPSEWIHVRGPSLFASYRCHLGGSRPTPRGTGR